MDGFCQSQTIASISAVTIGLERILLFCGTMFTSTANELTTPFSSVLSIPHSVEEGESLWFKRVVFDLCFFIVVGVILNNIVAGIILDVFGMLRDEASQRQMQMRNECFITGLSRDRFDDAGLNFEQQSSWSGKIGRCILDSCSM